MLTTNQKGLIAETAVIGECVRLGIGVCRPLDDERYDLILDLRPRLLRVQCTWAARYDDVVVARLDSNRRGPNGMITRRYTPDEVDCFAAHCAELGQSFLLRQGDPTSARPDEEQIRQSASAGRPTPSWRLNWRSFAGP
jgi:hypothetical protein